MGATKRREVWEDTRWLLLEGIGSTLDGVIVELEDARNSMNRAINWLRKELKRVDEAQEKLEKQLEGGDA